jgi:hypothetical protein
VKELEPLWAVAVLDLLAETIQTFVNHLGAFGVMALGKVIPVTACAYR